MIRLVGPGGAGKTTVGLPLTNRMGIPFVDLDEEFTVRAGDISSYLDAYGYRGSGRQSKGTTILAFRRLYNLYNVARARAPGIREDSC